MKKLKYDVNGEKIAHLTRTDRALLVSHALNNVISVFVSTFLISYIYSISENYVFNVGLFYMVNYAVMGVVMYVVSALIDRTNRVTFYRIAVVIRAIFLVLWVMTLQNMSLLQVQFMVFLKPVIGAVIMLWRTNLSAENLSADIHHFNMLMKNLFQ